jgi:hypothetical protein
MRILSEREHSVWLQKLSETTFVGDIKNLDQTLPRIPSKFWRGRIREHPWHYGTYTRVLNALVDDAFPLKSGPLRRVITK